jgi:hypothetical protein
VSLTDRLVSDERKILALAHGLPHVGVTRRLRLEKTSSLLERVLLNGLGRTLEGLEFRTDTSVLLNNVLTARMLPSLRELSVIVSEAGGLGRLLAHPLVNLTWLEARGKGVDATSFPPGRLFPKLTTLKLIYGSKGAVKALADAAERGAFPQLGDLVVHDMHIDDDVCKQHLARAVARMKNLRALDVKYNSFDSEGKEALKEAVKETRMLRWDRIIGMF